MDDKALQYWLDLRTREALAKIQNIPDTGDKRDEEYFLLKIIKEALAEAVSFGEGREVLRNVL